jgi:spermidine synthase
MGFLVLKSRPKRILMIGLGGGSLVKYCHRHLPTTELTVVEIDPEVIALRAHFYVPPDDERLQVINADGAQYVAQMVTEGGHTDAMLIDAYDQHGVAKAVMERGFFENAKQVLGRHGVFIFNLVASTRESKPHIQLIRSVFGEPVIAIAMPNDDNLVIFAGNALRNPRRLLLARRNAERVKGKLGLLFPNLVKHLGVCYQQLDRHNPLARAKIGPIALRHPGADSGQPS